MDAARRDRWEATRELQQAGVAAFPAMSNKDLATNEHLKDRGFLVQMEHPIVGRRIHTGIPWTMSGTPCEIRRAAPLRGADTDSVLKQLLGYSRRSDRQAARRRSAQMTVSASPEAFGAGQARLRSRAWLLRPSGFLPSASSERRAEKCRGSSVRARSKYMIAEAVLSTFRQHAPSIASSCAVSVPEASRARTKAPIASENFSDSCRTSPRVIHACGLSGSSFSASRKSGFGRAMEVVIFQAACRLDQPI